MWIIKCENVIKNPLTKILHLKTIFKKLLATPGLSAVCFEAVII